MEYLLADELKLEKFTTVAKQGWWPGNAGEKDGVPRLLTGKHYNSLKLKAPTSAISPVDYAGNLEAFLKERKAGEPFCFWYGGHEPHRAYEFGSGSSKGNKKLGDIDRVPAYWPDNDTVRQDMLDYAYEVEYFDQQLQKMLTILDRAGELDNTIVIVTSDNGMPFPRTKGHLYEFDNHLPLSIMWKKGIKAPGRKVTDFVSFIDLAPTILELSGLKNQTAMLMQGKSLVPLFTFAKSGQVDAARDHVLLGKERTDVGRPHDQGYPVRGIVKGKLIYTRNYEPDRWPSGNPETGYLDTDGGPTKTQILVGRRVGRDSTRWQLAFGKKGADEL
ncbi:Sulfatase [Dyadobacter soli]|uniref:Sulfatase n=1 Tax=Dyadobacter soli TaxID=659014 RepID=A0A1G7MR04_9BACT|nr:sulfatase-like hydrolase/transferase [Dyadobacter soli]SDF64192.1 Sulfatase [Dyadobacter soli]